MHSLTLIAALCVAQTPPNPGQAVSEMMALYAGAETLAGTIELTQSANNVTTKITTNLQLDRKGRRLFLSQSKPAGFNAGRWIVTADGKELSYPPTPEMFDRANADRGKMRNVEPMFLRDGTILNEKDAYAAGTKSIPDRSVPLDFAVARREDLEYVRNQFATLTFLRQEKMGNDSVNVFGGDWRAYGRADVSGTYEIWIDEHKQLRRYAHKQSLSLAPNTPVVTVISVWIVNLQPNGTVNPDLFKVIK